MHAPRPRRFPAAVFLDGSEPDPRFSLANERTFLAWIRTSLAFLAGGVALEVLTSTMHSGLRLTASIGLIALGILAAVQAWFGWARDERALRRCEPLPSPTLAPALVAGTILIAALVVLAVLLGD